MSGGATVEVVYGGKSVDAAGLAVGDDLQVGCVGSDDVAGGGQCALGQQHHEVLAFIGLGPYGANLLIAQCLGLVRHAGGHGGEDASGHGGENRREAEREFAGFGRALAGRVSEVLQNFGNVAVLAAHRIRQGGLQGLGGKQVGALEILAGTRVSDDQIGHDILRFNQSFGDAGLEGQRGGGDVAARACDALGAKKRRALAGV